MAHFASEKREKKNVMKTSLLFIIFLFLSGVIYSQEIEGYVFRVNATYLPNVTGQREYYDKKNGKLSHFAVDTKNKKHKLKKKDIQIALNKLDSLLNLDEFTFEISEAVVEEMKEREFCREIIDVSETDIDNFVQDRKITLRLKDIKIDISDYLAGQIDGAYYSYYLEIKKKNETTIKYDIKCRSGGVSNLELKDWLVLYFFYSEYDLLKTVSSVKHYLSEDKLVEVILRFIKFSKKL